jgi:hypothetical protein
MSETRRNIFKTSILSVFGLMTGGAIMRTAAQASPVTDFQNGNIHVLSTSGWVVLQPNGSDAYTAAYFTRPAAAWPWDSSDIINNCSPNPITSGTLAFPNTFTTLTISGGTISADHVNNLIQGLGQFVWNEIGVQHPLRFTVGGMHHRRRNRSDHA